MHVLGKQWSVKGQNRLIPSYGHKVSQNMLQVCSVGMLGPLDGQNFLSRIQVLSYAGELRNWHYSCFTSRSLFCLWKVHYYFSD